MNDLVIIFLASKLHIIIVGGALLFACFLRPRTRLCKWGIALPLTYVMGKVASVFFENPRPFVVEQIQPLVEHLPDNGFPSEHTLLVATVAFLVYAEHKKIGTVLLVLSLGVGVGRVMANVHHSIDVIGAYLIAFGAVQLSAYVCERTKVLDRIKG